MSAVTTNAADLRRASLAAMVGTTVEWYDFFIYGTAAALVFNKVFFSSLSPTVAILASFATFAVGFLARLAGAVVFGNLGDRLGRKKLLVVTLMMMAFSTVGIGLLPSYASIGVVAPILLIVLRIVQGMAVAGEWGGAVLIAAEKAAPEQRVWYGAFAQHGAPLGIILSSAVFALVTSMPTPAFLEWGWRLPFLFSAILVYIGFRIRSKVEESADFVAAREQQRLAKTPVIELFRTAWPYVLLMVGINAVAVSGTHFRTTYLLSWASDHTTLMKSSLLQVQIVAAFFTVVAQLFAARLSLHWPIKKLLVWTLIIYALTPFPLFWLVGTSNIFLAAMGIVISGMCGGAYYALLAGYSSQIFPVAVRYSGISMGYHVSGAIFASITPLLSTALVDSHGGAYWPAASLYSAYCGVSLISLLVLWAYQRRGSAIATASA